MRNHGVVRTRSAVAAFALGALLAPPLLGQRYDTPDTVAVHSGALSLRALLWRPAGRGPFPAVLFNHGSGPTDDPRKPATLGRIFARHGYVFLYMYRRGAGLSKEQGTNSAELMARSLAKEGQDGRNRRQLELLDAELTDVVAGLWILRTRSDVDAPRIAAIGHSFGGQLSLLLAERDSSLRAVVVFGPASASWAGSPGLRRRLLTAVDHISAPVFFIHAMNDYSTEPGKALSAEMNRLGKPNRLELFPAVGSTPADGHDFIHSSVATWEPEVFAFLDEHLSSPNHR